MKTFLAFSFMMLAVNGHYILHASKPHNASELAKVEGYPTETYFVDTEDGYRLEITRVLPHKDKGHLKHDNTGKSVVLLMHGILADSSEFVLNSENSLAYLLADKGFDVFLGNFRGTHHKKLSGQKDRAFWDICFDDMGAKDLPAIIDKVLRVTDGEKLYYVGFNQANTALYALLSQKVAYNKKIEKAVSMGPLAFMAHSRNPLMQLISENYRSPTWVAKWLGSHQFIPSEDFNDYAQKQCTEKHGDDELCSNIYFLINGFATAHQTPIAKKFDKAYPASASTQELLHYAQLMKSGKFESYYLNPNPQEYDLTRITAPIIIVSVPQDTLDDERDVTMLQNSLPNLVEHIKVEDYNSNIDLIIGENVRNVVYERVVKSMI